MSFTETRIEKMNEKYEFPSSGTIKDCSVLSFRVTVDLLASSLIHCLLAVSLGGSPCLGREVVQPLSMFRWWTERRSGSGSKLELL